MVRWKLQVVLAVVALSDLVACGAFSTSTAVAEARNALQCSSLDGPFARPHRYGNLGPSHELFRGCGKYVVLRCTHTTAQDSCQAVEVLDARTAEEAEPFSFSR